MMDAIQMIKERRSVRQFKDQQVDRELMKEIVALSQYAPSWTNSQTARWTLIDDKAIIEQIANTAVKGFTYNIDTLKNTPGVAILSFVKGKGGKLEKYGIDGENTEKWEVFDSGIACQTFCLAAHAKGVGTCIFGVIDEEQIAKIIDLPTDEAVGTVVVYGYPEGEAKMPRRKPLEDVLRFK